MTDDASQAVFSYRWVGGERVDPACVADERTMLSAYLDYYRSTIELKCSGVPDGRLGERAVPPSTLSLHGLIRHLAGVERWWVQMQFAGLDLPEIYYTDDDPSQDFDLLDGDVEEALAVWRGECASSRAIVAAAESMDSTGTRRSTGEPVTLRWVMLRMITEYARHSGHADLLRERIDGRTGE